MPASERGFLMCIEGEDHLDGTCLAKALNIGQQLVNQTALQVAYYRNRDLLQRSLLELAIGVVFYFVPAMRSFRRSANSTTGINAYADRLAYRSNTISRFSPEMDFLDTQTR